MRSGPYKQRGPFQCHRCGVSFHTNRAPGEGEKYCSRTCYFEYRREHPSKTYQALSFCRVHTNTCTTCGKVWLGRKARVSCSDECDAALTRVRSRQYAEAAHVSRACTCKHCRTPFVTQYGVKRREFCSDRCALRYGRVIGKAKRRAVERGLHAERINPLDIFERDGWRCQICGKDTPQQRRGSCYSNAPELDHRIPLAQGGEHTHDNVQCACRACNNAKGGSLVIGQLSLIGQRGRGGSDLHRI